MCSYLNRFLNKVLFQDDKNPPWKCICTVSGYHSRTIFSVKWSKLNNLIATGSADNSIHIFKESLSNEQFLSPDQMSLTLLHVQNEAHSQDVNCVDWNPTQKGLLASCSDDGTIKIWRYTEND